MSGVVPPLFYVPSRSEQGESNIRRMQKKKDTQFDSTANQVNPITCWLPEVSSDLLLQQFPLD